MTLLTILLGIAGLGLVVFFHELGHFIAARLVGITVEEFSLGWGPKLVGFTKGKTTYRISVLPLGGYCKMKGEDGYRKALEEGLEDFPRENGSYFGASPLKRIFVSLAGPFMNIVFAFAVFSCVLAIGYEERTWANRIVLASEYDGLSYAADKSGMQSGDVITELGNKPIENFSDIQEAIALSADKELSAKISRDGQIIHTVIRPQLDTNSGAGKAGIYPWIEASIADVASGKSAAVAGLQPGDSIISIDGLPVRHAMDFILNLEKNKPVSITIEVMRNGSIQRVKLIPEFDANGNLDVGLGWMVRSIKISSNGFVDTLVQGIARTKKTIVGTYQGLVSLFTGVNVLKAVSGPVRITWMVGEAVTDGIAANGFSGLSYVFNFLAVLSIGLFVMNLLPIPLLDGGSIVLFVIEAIRRKHIKVKTVFRYQTFGLAAVALLFLVSTVSDILFFSGH